MRDVGTELPVPGVTSMDHTADLALEVRAPDYPELLRRAAGGMAWLILEERPGADDVERHLRVTSDGPAGLLREWLRELLYWHEAEGFSPARVEFETVDPTGGPESEAVVEAVVHGGPDVRTPVREIKGVTLHGLAAEPRDGGWYGRVIFDV